LRALENIAEGTRHENGLYVVEHTSLSEHLAAAVVASSTSTLRKWHHRLGHLGRAGLLELKKKGLLPDITEAEMKEALSDCTACIQAKITQTPFPQQATRRETRRLMQTKSQSLEKLRQFELDVARPEGLKIGTRLRTASLSA